MTWHYNSPGRQQQAPGGQTETGALGGSSHSTQSSRLRASLSLHRLQSARVGIRSRIERDRLSAAQRHTEGHQVRRTEVTLWWPENSRSTQSGLQCLSLVLNLCNNVVWSLIRAKNLIFGPSILNPTWLGDLQQLPPFSGLLLHLLKAMLG